PTLRPLGSRLDDGRGVVLRLRLARLLVAEALAVGGHQKATDDVALLPKLVRRELLQHGPLVGRHDHVEPGRMSFIHRCLLNSRYTRLDASVYASCAQLRVNAWICS